MLHQRITQFVYDGFGLAVLPQAIVVWTCVRAFQLRAVGMFLCSSRTSYANILQPALSPTVSKPQNIL